MTNTENLYLNAPELALYNQIQADILNTKNTDTVENLKNNAFCLINNAMYRKFNKL